ncbi:hypothetical protein DNTS_024230 [Danionella cerebrum]|uniref:Spermatogenesis-associated protein 48 n=1 Tax=Danionella cerebrum TaxID=2873325 RepID=A0A553QB50_9TELE|nr:hypothetical protein DNTS_024230 [Danionella translucida]
MAVQRNTVCLIDPCSGQLSAGAEVQLGVKFRGPFIDRYYAPSDLWVPAGSRDRPQTPPTRPSALIHDKSEHKRWNSRMKPEAAVKSIATGGTTINEQVSEDFHGSNAGAEQSVLFDSMTKAARHYIYTSATQRAYEDVDWDSQLPPRHEPPSTSLEKMADPVTQGFVLKQKHSRPELWQVIGSSWSKNQIRATFNPKKPISFTSPCAKSGHMPLYSGTVGSKNMDNVDAPEEDFTPLTVLRTKVPPYTPSSYRNAIPGYTGKARFDRAQTSDISLPFIQSAQRAGIHSGRWSSSLCGHKAPLSRMITTVSPRNPYIKPKA